MLQELTNKYREFKEIPIPKGFHSACQDIDIEFYEYDGIISGLIEKFLTGIEIDRAEIDMGKDLERRLQDCADKLQEIVVYKEKINEIISLLIQCLEEA